MTSARPGARVCARTGLVLVPTAGERAYRVALSSYGPLNPPVRGLPSPERRPVWPPVRDRVQRCKQHRVDTGQGLRPGRGTPVQHLVPVDRAGEFPAEDRDLPTRQPLVGGVPDLLAGEHR